MANCVQTTTESRRFHINGLEAWMEDEQCPGLCAPIETVPLDLVVSGKMAPSSCGGQFSLPVQ